MEHPSFTLRKSTGDGSENVHAVVRLKSGCRPKGSADWSAGELLEILEYEQSRSKLGLLKLEACEARDKHELISIIRVLESTARVFISIDYSDGSRMHRFWLEGKRMPIAVVQKGRGNSSVP